MRAIVLAYFIFWVISKLAGQKKNEGQEEEKEASGQNESPRTTMTRVFGLDIEDPADAPTHAPSSLEHWLETEDLAKARAKHAKKKKAKEKTESDAPMSLTEELRRSREGKSNFDMKAERLRDRAEDMKVEHLSDQPRDFMKPERLQDEHHIEYAPIAKDADAPKDAYREKDAKKEKDRDKARRANRSWAKKAMLYREIIDEPVSMRESRMF